jgi:hypothetical protein
MLIRIVSMFAFAVLLAPKEPNLGIGQPSLLSQVPTALELRQEALRRLTQVRADLKANAAHL